MHTQPAIDTVLKSAAARGDVAGVVAMAATRDGGTVYEGAFGRRVLPDGAAMTTDTVFSIASMTKAITCTAALQLVEQGRLQLDAPIGDTVPELRSPQVLQGFDAAGQPRLRPARRPITLRHLMTHTAGFGYDMWSEDLIRYQKIKDIPGIISCRNVALTTPLLFDPGDQWFYGINIDWVGKAVEKASGQRLDAYFHDHIFVPLGMQDAAFKLTPSHRTRLAGTHTRQPDGSLAPMDFEIPQDPEFHMGGGGLYATAADYLAFTQIFLHGGSKVLKPESVRAMSENQIGALNVIELKTAIPPYTNDAEFYPGMVKKWSLGFMINTEPVPDARSAGSLAWAGLGNTYFWIDQAKGVTGVILTQVLPFADAKVLDLYGKFEAATYAALA